MIVPSLSITIRIQPYRRRVEEVGTIEPVIVNDLLGCRFRRTQRVTHPDTDYTDEEKARRERLAAARAKVFGLLPTKRGLGDGRSRRFLRLDAGGDELDTLECLAEGADLITNAAFSGVIEGSAWRGYVDILARWDASTYLPVIVTNHRVARQSKTSQATAISTSRLSLSKPLEVPFKVAHHASESHQLALAHLGLEAAGCACGFGAVVGQDRRHAFLEKAAPAVEGLEAALRVGFTRQPHRLKECTTCRFWSLCEQELLRRDDVSLVFPGQYAYDLQKRGLGTVEKLIDAGVGEPSQLALAWRQGITLMKKETMRPMPRADVEIDIDVEAYLDQGAYLWGTFDGETYRGYVTWSELGGREEAANFAEFWKWLTTCRRQAHQRKQSFAAYCYSAHGENHWLRASARRFAEYPDVPTENEINAFISSTEWVDVFANVRANVCGPYGIGLKIVAPVAGFSWRDDGFTGEDSVAEWRIAVSDEPEASYAREILLRYNEDDCRATAQVRAWLAAGAPGAPVISEIGAHSAKAILQ